jgi:hypothetical protein
MKEPELKITQRMLPHWEYDGSIYFITFNTRHLQDFELLFG